MDNIKISFVIPAYNEEKILARCLNSILAEIKNNPLIKAEVIVVNNASTDNTKNVALTFAPAVTVVDEKQKGLVFARSTGAKVAKGEILAHVDADCILPRGWLAQALKEFSENKNLVALSGPYFYYDLSKFQSLQVKVFYYLTYLVYFFNRFIFRVGSFLQGGNFLVTAKAWNQIGQSSSDFSFYGEDTDLCRRLYKVGEVKFTFKLPMNSSARRLLEEGIVKIGARYSANYFSTLFLKKPFTKKYKDIRHP